MADTTYHFSIDGVKGFASFSLPESSVGTEITLQDFLDQVKITFPKEDSQDKQDRDEKQTNYSTPEDSDYIRKGIEIEVLEWFEKLFQATIAVATLGAGFTFSTILGGLDESNDEKAAKAARVRRLLSVAWLLFVIAIAAAAAGSLAFNFARDWHLKFAGQPRQRFVTSIVSLSLQMLMLIPFLLIGLAIEEYVHDVGVAAVWVTSTITLLAFLAWIVVSL